MTEFSGETGQDFSDEAESSDSFSSSEGRQPSPHASGDKPESGKQTTTWEHEDKPSELSDLNSNGTKLSRKWISHLKSNKSNSGQYSPDTKIQKELTPVPDKELNALQSFCNIKINLIHRRLNCKEEKSRRGKKRQLRLDAEVPDIDVQECTVPDEILNRIYFENTKATLKQVSATKQHISSQCHSCNRKRAELAQSAFLKRKTTLLQSLLLQQKIDEHLHTNDFLTFVGEAHKGLPRLSDDPRLIWKRLTEKCQIRCSGFEKSDADHKGVTGWK